LAGFRAPEDKEALSQIGLLLRLYLSPLKTFSRILDEGRLVFAALAAVAVLLVMQVPRAAEYQLQRSREINQAVLARIDKAAKKAIEKHSVSAEEMSRDLDMEGYLAGQMSAVSGLRAIRTAADRFTAHNPTQYFSDRDRRLLRADGDPGTDILG
jgi:hypothetical protein